MNYGPCFQKQKIIIQKVSERHQLNFAACIVTAGGICVPKINILGGKLWKLEISPIALQARTCLKCPPSATVHSQQQRRRRTAYRLDCC